MPRPTTPTDNALQLERLYEEIRQIIVDREEQEWRRDAACVGIGPDKFFADRGDFGTVRSALAVCAECPVQEQCREYGIATRARHGVWGGLGASRVRGLQSGAPLASARCARCGEAFTPRNRNQMYCCRDCKNRSNLVRRVY